MLFSTKPAAPAESGGGPALEESEVLLLKKSQSGAEPSLLRALCLTFGPYFLVSCFYKAVQDVLMFTGPEILR